MAATVTITRNTTLPNSSDKADFHNLVDTATLAIANIANADVAADAAIVDTKLAAITTAGKVSGAALTLLPNTPSGAGKLPVANVDTGATANKIVILDGSAKLPAVDGSALTNINVGCYIGSFTIDATTASGTQNVTGLGLTPKRVIFFACIGSSARSSQGFDDGTNCGCVYSNAGGTAANRSSSTSYSIYIDESDWSYTGKISALASGQFTVTWTKTGSATGTITVIFMAIA